MSKKLSITLLILVAFFLLGFSITANAKPPFLEDKPQLIQSSTLFGEFFVCSVTNVSDDDLDVHLQFIREDGLLGIGGYLEPLASGLSEAGVQSLTSGQRFRCTVSWFGQPDDFMANLCFRNADLAAPISGCVELR